MSDLSLKIKTQFTTVITDQSFCDQLVSSVQTSNISALNIPTQLTAIRNICNISSEPPKITFTSVIIPKEIVPSRQPSSALPLHMSSLAKTNNNAFVMTSILGISLIVTAVLCCVGLVVLLFCCSRKRVSKSHQYDILVLSNNNEEIIFQNINHGDIIASRRYGHSFYQFLLLLISESKSSSAYMNRLSSSVLYY